jgi:8-oxo-dGTP pyrophosphatase MutT (NUDIX family)
MNQANDTQDIVGVICIDKKGKVLLVQGNGGKWSFPKGRRKENETNYNAALREAKEEAGIDLSNRGVNAKIQLRYGTYYMYAFGRSGDEIPLEKPLTPDEIQAVKWVDTKSIDFQVEDKNADLRVYLNKR